MTSIVRHDYKFNRELTFPEMSDIREAITDHGGSGALSSFYWIATGGVMEDIASVDPTKYRIPKAQFNEIAQWILHAERTFVYDAPPNGLWRWNTFGPWPSPPEVIG